MRLHRFIVDTELHSSVTISDPDLCHQLGNVFRMKRGDVVVLCDGKGKEGMATIEKLTEQLLHCSIAEVRSVAEPERKVTLYCSVLKRENFEWAVQKSVEVGISAIVPIITSRTVKTGLKLDRLRSIAKEAAEQSGRGVVPSVSEPIAFDDALHEVNDGKQQVLFHYEEHSTSTSYQLSATSCSGIWVGPEGGWSEEEVTHALARGFRVASLGALTLRAETAAVIGSYLTVRIDQGKD